MARGWESKSVEEQQSEFQRSEGGKASQSAEEKARSRQVRALELQLAQVHQRLKHSENPRYVELLRQELAYLEHQLKQLE